MKPQFIFAIVFVTLFGGVLVSRTTGVGGLTVVAHADDSASRDATTDNSAAFVRLKGSPRLGDGEYIALQAIAKSLASSPALPIAIEWTEVYHNRRTHKQAIYLPQQQKLRCSDGRYGSYEYQPVTPAGINAALSNGPTAPFASANLCSLPLRNGEVATTP